MNKQLTVINFLWAVVDTLITALAILAFSWGAWYFNRWGLLFANLIPLVLFTNHGLLINTDLEAAKEEDIECMQEQEGDHGYDR